MTKTPTQMPKQIIKDIEALTQYFYIYYAIVFVCGYFLVQKETSAFSDLTKSKLPSFSIAFFFSMIFQFFLVNLIGKFLKNGSKKAYYFALVASALVLLSHSYSLFTNSIEFTILNSIYLLADFAVFGLALKLLLRSDVRLYFRTPSSLSEG